MNGFLNTRLLPFLILLLFFFAGTAVSQTIPNYSYRIVKVYPHDTGAFTQGLVYSDGFLYEGTGQNGETTLRKVDLKSGTVLQLHELPDEYFGEGITIFGNKIIQLTWQSNTGFYYDKESFMPIEQFYYSTEGWGITHDGEQLIMSDGTAVLHFLDPHTFQETATIEVTDDKGSVKGLNELEYINGEIYANVWPSERIARISPSTGKVVGWIDLKGILGFYKDNYQVDVLNGIAFDSEQNRLFVTGKYWPKLFEIKLVPAK